MPNKNPQQWREFLEELSELIFAHASQRESSVIVSHLSEEMRSRRYVGFDGASETQICEAEKRLGVKFPPSYRTFLSVSNGFPAVWHSVEPGALYDTQEIGWARELDTMTVEIFGHEAVRDWPEVREEEHLQGREFQGAYRAQYVQNLLCISEDGDACRLFLSPEVVNSDGEWECWLIGGWCGADRHESFENWFGSRYEFWKDQLEQRAK